MVNNDYLNVKGLEEKVKAKRQKGGLEVKAPENVLDLATELDKQVDMIVSNIFELHRGVVK